MSVILFSGEELGNLAAWMIRSGGDIAATVEALATYSVGNAIAYGRTYRETVEPVSALEIARAARLAKFDAEQARGTLRLLVYNGISNSGRETRMVGYFAALQYLYQTAARSPEASRVAA